MSLPQPGIKSMLLGPVPKYTLCFGPKVTAIEFPLRFFPLPIILRMFKHTKLEVVL